jgi:hypothetical protein
MPFKLNSLFAILLKGAQIFNKTPVEVSSAVKKKNGKRDGNTTTAQSVIPFKVLSIYFLGKNTKISIKKAKISKIIAFLI